MASRNYLLDIDFLTHSPFVRWFFGHDYTATLKISNLFCYQFPIWLFCDRFDEGCVCHVGYDFRSLKCFFYTFCYFSCVIVFCVGLASKLWEFSSFHLTHQCFAMRYDLQRRKFFYCIYFFIFFSFLVVYYFELCDMWYIIH